MTPSGGGSRGVGGGPAAPNSAEDIVRSLFEGEGQKKLDSAQQAQNLQNQSRQQQDLRDASGQSRSAHEAEGHEGDVKNRQPGAETRARTADRAGTAKERELDSFLARASNQSAQREAGRNLSKPQTLSSINAQAWTVAGSPHTPETARQVLQNRQQQQTATPNRNPSGTAQPNQSGTNPALLARMPLPMPRQPTANQPAVVIRYGPPLSSGGETAARAFTGRPLQMDNLRGQLQRLVQDQLGRTAQQSLGNQPQVAVHVRGNVVFVRDGEKTRAFKLDKDGNLTELPSEDAGDSPLSPEAQKLLEKVLRQKGIQTKLGQSGADHAGELSEARLEELLAEQVAEEKGAQGELDFETKFALILHEVLEEGRSLGEALEGDPMFPNKADWEAFFGNLLKTGNQEKAGKKSMEEMMDMIFRGLFQKKGKGKVLVGDLKFLQGGKAKEEKFAQMPLTEAQMAALMKGLKPGQKISKEQLAKLFGKDIEFVKLAHVEERAYNMASSAEKNVVFNPKSNVDLYGQARLEKSILSTRKEKSLPLPPNGSGTGAGAQTVPADPTPLLGLREKFQGKPKVFTIILYGVVTALIAIIIVLVSLKMFS